MVAQGKSQTEVCELLGVNKNSVSSWKKKHQKDGIKGLKERPKGKTIGAFRLISQEQEKQIQKLITDKMPDQLKLPFALWTRKAIKEVIEREYGVKIALRTISDYLKRWGYSPQKPMKRAYEQNPKAVERWLNKDYPAIKARAKKEKATIHWGDEIGVKNQSQYGRSYAPKGQTPVLVQTGKRLSLNMISTVTNQGLIRFKTYSGSMTSEVMIKFLSRLIKSETQKIYLILDNLKVHHSKPVKAWVEKHSDNIFAQGTNHINGIESFWSYAKKRFEKFHGLKNKTFNLHLKECEFRFNNRDEHLYLLLLKEFKNNPLF